MHRDRVGRVLFPPLQVAQLTALACARPQEVGQPLARFSVRDLCRRAQEHRLPGSGSTLWRLLHQAALRPWFQQQWLFPQDPDLLAKATPVLELYPGRWQGQPLGPHDVVVCADELTNLRPLARHRTTTPPAPGQAGRYEFSHDQPRERRVYLALREVRTGFVSGLVSPQSGSAVFAQLVEQYLATDRAAAAEQIYLIVDNGAAHHPSTAATRMAALDARITVVHLPVHSSWLNQIELYFSLVKRKALTPMDLPDAAALEERLLAFERYYNERAAPFHWHYTVADLQRYIQRLAARGQWPPPPTLRDRRHEQKPEPLTLQ